MNNQTLYFYDLETTGINPRESRIMQFAGQRTNLNLEPIGEPDNIIVKLTNDILPDPQAILVTGITPQKTVEDGINEREFAEYFVENVATPGTTIMGYNTVRFDNEFMRYLMYRNFYDAYEWSYKNNITIWDLLDLVRITRALRPEGIEWTFASDGRPSNRLELITAVNKISHEDAHDALSDVRATIAVAKLIKTKQPKLYEYLFNLRTKKEVQKLVAKGEPFVYTSGRYSGENEKTTVAVMIGEHPVYAKARALVYDLRVDPTEFMSLNEGELMARMDFVKKGHDAPARLPVKELIYNKCPAIAPLGVLNEPAQSRLSIDLSVIKANYQKLLKDPTFVERVKTALESKQEKRQQSFTVDTKDVDARLYDGFFNDADKRQMSNVRRSTAEELADLHPNFADERLDKLLFLLKARQAPKSLSQDEQAKWETYRQDRLMSGDDKSRMALYFKKLQELGESAKDDKQKNLLQDLWYWGESIAPYES